MNNCFFQGPLGQMTRGAVRPYALGVRGTGHDPMNALQTVVRTADKSTQQLFYRVRRQRQEHRARRLAANLGDEGYTPVLIDSEEYLNLSVPPRVNDLLATVAAGVDKFIQEKCQGMIPAGLQVVLGAVPQLPSTRRWRSRAQAEDTRGRGASLKLKQDVSFKAKIYPTWRKTGGSRIWAAMPGVFA